MKYREDTPAKINPFFALTLTSTIAMALNFITGILIANSLGPLGRGLYQIIKNFQAIIPSLLNLSLGAIYSSKEDSSNLGLAKYKYHMIFAWLISIFILFETPYYRDISRPSIQLIALSFPVFFASNLTTAILLRNCESTKYLRYYAITNIGTPILIFLSYFFTSITLEKLVLCLIIPNLINFILTSKLTFVQDSCKRSIYALKRPIAVVHLSNFSRVLISSIDQMLIVSILGIESLGIYMVAFSCTSIFSIFTSSAISMVPIWCKNRNIFRRKNVQFVTFLFSASLISFLVLPLIIDRFILHLLDEQFSEVLKIFPIIAIGVLINSFNEFTLAQMTYLGQNAVLFCEKILHFGAIFLFIGMLRNEKSLQFQSFFLMLTGLPSAFFLIFSKKIFLKEARILNEGF